MVNPIRKAYKRRLKQPKNRGFSSLCAMSYILHEVPNTPIALVELSIAQNSTPKRDNLVRIDTSP